MTGAAHDKTGARAGDGIPAGLTNDQWYDLAQRHVNADWNSDQPDGFLNAIKAVARDFATIAAAPAAPSVPAGWVSFADLEPPRDARLDNPEVVAGRRVLVTNNVKARDAMGRMSHVWFVSPIKTNDGWVAFDEADRKIFDLTYWFDPLAGVQAPATGEAA
ncbi:hypothetical protein [Roseateles sp. BYS96W]|uniref:Uncharacterized protein n=1 Tax=Pelomonas nitida TaxID=3299027 RepID=A0ABW7G7F8_9BURK